MIKMLIILCACAMLQACEFEAQGEIKQSHFQQTERIHDGQECVQSMPPSKICEWQ